MSIQKTPVHQLEGPSTSSITKWLKNDGPSGRNMWSTITAADVDFSTTFTNSPDANILRWWHIDSTSIGAHSYNLGDFVKNISRCLNEGKNFTRSSTNTFSNIGDYFYSLGTIRVYCNVDTLIDGNIDGDDAVALFVDGRPLATWYSNHVNDALGYKYPNGSDRTTTSLWPSGYRLTKGWHTITILHTEISGGDTAMAQIRATPTVPEAPGSGTIAGWVSLENVHTLSFISAVREVSPAEAFFDISMLYMNRAFNTTTSLMDLNADRVDGLHASSFVRSDISVGQNSVLAGPTSGSGNPSFRTLVATDIPSLNYLPLTGGTLSGLLTLNTDVIHNSSTNTKHFYFTRTGSTVQEYMRVGLDDNFAYFDYNNDEYLGNIRFQINNTDTESGGGAQANTSTLTFSSNNAGAYLTIKYKSGAENTFWHTGNFTNNSTNWNAAYTYSQVGHLPLTGGTLSNTLTGTVGTFDTISVNKGQSQTQGNGISLYGGTSTGAPTYGIMFSGTATFGSHGTVTGDWATYLTMNSSSNRGWIFRAGTTNVASINSLGNAAFASINASGNATFDGSVTINNTGGLNFGSTVTNIITANSASTVSFAHTSSSTPVAFEFTKGGTSLADSDIYGVLYLSRTNHNNASTNVGASLIFRLKNSAGSLVEAAAISGVKLSDTTGQLRFYGYGRALMGTWDATALKVGDNTVWHAGNMDISTLGSRRSTPNKLVLVNTLQPIARFVHTEGTVQLQIAVRSRTGGHSGTNVYMFQGGFSQLAINVWYKMEPLSDGRGHGNSTGGFELWVRMAPDNYNYEFGVTAVTTNKYLDVSFTDLQGYFGSTYTDLSTTAAIATPSSAGTVYSVRTMRVENTVSAKSMAVTDGIQLFDAHNYSGGKPTYGVMFTTTASQGTHGKVIGDYATYFTTANSTNRGWIFQHGTDNVASINGVGALTTNADANIQGITVGRGGGNEGNSTAVGMFALMANTTGFGNTAVGRESLRFTTTGTHNIAVGLLSLFSNTTGNFNIAIGNNALYNSTSSSSVAIGYEALKTITTGNNNVAVGHRAGSLSTGSGNVAVGIESLMNSTSNGNTALGAYTLKNSGLGNANTAIGYASMLETTTGYYNVSVGYEALRQNTSGNNNVAIGFQASYLNVIGVNNTAIGGYAMLNSTGSNVGVAVGFEALRYNTTGSILTAVGSWALCKNTTGTYSTAVGYQALFENTSAIHNTALGYYSLANTTTGGYNTAVGGGALGNSNAANNVAVGFEAMRFESSGGNNVALGWRSAYSTTTGSVNVFVGSQVAYDHTTGQRNTIIGYNSGRGITTGSYNTIIGANVIGLSPTLNQTIILADGAGNIRYWSTTTGTGIGTTTPAYTLDVNGVIGATGGNSTNWNTAFGWGNHASAGYWSSTSMGGIERSSGTGTDLNTTGSGLIHQYGTTSAWLNMPVSSYGHALTLNASINMSQFYMDIRHGQTDFGDLYFRTKNTTGWATWRKLWHSGNLTPSLINAFGTNGANQTNLDTALTEGQYHYINTSTNTPAASTYGTLVNFVSSGQVQNNSNNWLTQLAIDTLDEMHFRKKINSAAFTAWRRVWHSGNLNHATADFTAQALTVTGQAHVASDVNINNGAALNARHINGRTTAASGANDHLHLQYSNGFNVYIGAAATPSNLTTYGTITSSAAQPTLLNLTRTNSTVNVGVQYSSTSTTIFAGMGSAGEFAIGTAADLTGGAFKVAAASGNMSTTGTITAGSTATAKTFMLANDATDTVSHRFSLHSGTNTEYGMMLWNTNGTVGAWSTMIYGSNQSNRRISFGKQNTATMTLHSHITEGAHFNLDDWSLNITGTLNSSTSAVINTTTPGTAAKYNIHFTRTSTADFAQGITWAGHNTDNVAAGIYVQNSGSYGTKMYFATTNNYTTGAQTRMMIDQLGNVGIGTVSPNAAAKLTVNGNIYAGPSSNVQIIGADNGGLSYNAQAASALYIRATAYNNPIIFTQATNGEILRIADSGNVGIGTVSPTTKLDVNGTITATRLISTQATGTAPFAVTSTTLVTNLNTEMLGGFKAETGQGKAWGFIPVVKSDGVMEMGRYIDFTHTSNSGADFHVRLSTDGASNSDLYINSNAIYHAGNLNRSTVDFSTRNLNITGKAVIEAINNDDAAIIELNTRYMSENWRARIISDYYGGKYAAAVQHGMSFIGGRDGFENFRWFTKALVEHMTLSKDGNLTVKGNITSNSDARLKTNIEDYKNGIETVLKLRPVTFDWVDRDIKDDFGFIADEIKETLPSVVLEGDDSNKTLSMDYSRITAVLTKAVQEQQDIINKQNATIEELMNRLERLENRLK